MVLDPRRGGGFMPERGESELEGRLEFAKRLIDGVPMGIVMVDADLRVQFANASFYEAFQLDPPETESRPIHELADGSWNILRLREWLEDILRGETGFDEFEVEHEFGRIGRRIILLGARRLDRENLILLAIRDVTEERRAAAERESLLRELQHRVRNILNNVQAIVTQMRPGSSDLNGFLGAFETRLRALARTQDLLVRGPLEKVPLIDLVRSELEAAFVNSFQTKTSLAADSLGIDYVLSKTMLWRRDTMERIGGLGVLASGFGDDVLARKAVVAAGLRARLARPVPHAVGRRTFRQVWQRQLRWMRATSGPTRRIHIMSILLANVLPFWWIGLLTLTGALPWVALPAFIAAWRAG